MKRSLRTLQLKTNGSRRQYSPSRSRYVDFIETMSLQARQSSDDELIRQQLAEKETELEELRSERDRLKGGIVELVASHAIAEEVDESVKAKLLEETKQMKRDFEAQLKEFKEAAQKEASFSQSSHFCRAAKSQKNFKKCARIATTRRSKSRRFTVGCRISSMKSAPSNSNSRRRTMKSRFSAKRRTSI